MTGDTNTQTAFESAVGHHQAGRLAEAEKGYGEILAADPDHAGALHLLGVIRHQTGKFDLAVELITKAVAIAPDDAEAHNNLGNALKSQRKLDKAMACYRRCVEIDPDYAMAHNNLGNVLKDQGKLDEAVTCYRRALEAAPNYAVAHFNLGNALRDAYRPDEAVDCYRRALKFAPKHAAAHNNLGNVLKDQGKLDEAKTCFQRCVEITSDYALAHCNLGEVLWGLGELDDAVVACNRAIELDSAFAPAHFNLGKTLLAKGTLEAAAASYKRAIECDPGHLQAHFGLSAILNATGRQAEARRILEQGVRRQPIGNARTARGEPRAKVLELVGTRSLRLYIEEGRSQIFGKFFDTSFVIDGNKFTVHRYYMSEDRVSSTAKEDLSRYDIVMNCICDPDAEPVCLNIADQLIARAEVPFINDPRKIRNTSRERISELLAGIENLVVPRVVRVRLPDKDPSLFVPIIEKHGLRLPVIVRPVGGHGGEGMVKVDGVDDFDHVTFPESDLEFYLIEFHDFQDDDGYYRKTRFVFIDGELLPMHLLISNHWNVHVTARHKFMKNSAWMKDEENSYLEDPYAYMGQENRSAVEEINRRIGLDVFGVDYAKLPNGKLLLFEANAAMLMTREPWQVDYPYKNKHGNKVKAAFEEMMFARIGRS